MASYFSLNSKNAPTFGRGLCVLDKSTEIIPCINRNRSVRTQFHRPKRYFAYNIVIRHPYSGSKPIIRKVWISSCQITRRNVTENHNIRDLIYAPKTENIINNSQIVDYSVISLSFWLSFAVNCRWNFSQTGDVLCNRCRFLHCCCHRLATVSRGVESITSCPA